MKARLEYQSYGTAVLLFIRGETYEDAYGKYLSLYNWNATSSDPKQVGDTTICCWSTPERFQKYLFDINEHRLWDSGKSQSEINKLAKAAAEAEFAAIPYESYRSVHNEFETAEFGVQSAEKPDMDFKDAVLEYAMTRRED